MFDRSNRGGTGTTIVTSDNQVIRFRFGDACGDSPNAYFRAQLDADSGLAIGIFQIVD